MCKRNKEYYCVIEGRVDEPTIFSSWGDVHPRVIGCRSRYKGFVSLQDARNYMRHEQIERYKEVLKATAQGTTPTRNDMAYYAVAHGENPGIREVWYGASGALEEIHEVSGACHKRFGKREQAEAFIEDWKETYAEIWRREVKEKLDQGFRPHDMKVNTEGILREGNDGSTIDTISRRFDSVVSLE